MIIPINPPSPTLESTFIHIENFSIYGVMDVRRVKNIELKKCYDQI